MTDGGEGGAVLFRDFKHQGLLLLFSLSPMNHFEGLLSTKLIEVITL